MLVFANNHAESHKVRRELVSPAWQGRFQPRYVHRLRTGAQPEIRRLAE
jgi:hypothetical protein